jgi:Fe-S-cluster containining protein
MPKVEEYDCQKCGACCAFFVEPEIEECKDPKPGELYMKARPAVLNAPLFKRDLERMPKRIRQQLVRFNRPRRQGPDMDQVDTGMRLPAKKTEWGYACKFFKGELGGSCSCGIYAHRPFHCRYFIPDPDNPNCVLSRTAFGFEKKKISEWKCGGRNSYQHMLLLPFIKRPRKSRTQLYYEEARSGLKRPAGDYIKKSLRTLEREGKAPKGSKYEKVLAT